MHDTNLEERLRSVLRAEGDGLPFTVTSDELERRLLLRRRARNSQRLTLLAAGFAALAVGAIFAFGSGLFGDRNVAVDPSPSPTDSTSSADPSSSPPTSASPSTTPAPTPRVAEAIGDVGQAVLVTRVGEDSRRPDAFEVTRFDPVTGESVTLATFPGSILPDDGWLDVTESPPQVSTTGLLAIPFTRGPNEDEKGPSIAIVDTRAPDAAPWILDGYTSMSWDQSDRLVVERDGVVSVASVSTRLVEPAFPRTEARIAANGHGEGMQTGPAVAVQDGVRFLATTADDAQAWGYLGLDGRFTATNDLPPVYQRAGRERPVGAAAHSLGSACDSGPDAASAGCYLIESNEKHEPIATWLDYDAGPMLFDFAWAGDGRSVWMLLDDGVSGGRQVAALAYATDPDTRVELARIDFATGSQPRIFGFADEPTPGSATVVAIGDGQGLIHAFVLQDGTVVTQDRTASFAGWAADPPAYDPD